MVVVTVLMPLLCHNKSKTQKLFCGTIISFFFFFFKTRPWCNCSSVRTIFLVSKQSDLGFFRLEHVYVFVRMSIFIGVCLYVQEFCFFLCVWVVFLFFFNINLIIYFPVQQWFAVCRQLPPTGLKWYCKYFVKTVT